MSFFFLVLGAIFLIGAVWLFYRHEVSAYTALLSISLVILGIVLFVMGVVVKQGNMIQREIWMLQSHRLEEQGNKGSSPAEVPAKSESEAAFAAPRRASLR
jgi:hypothetical protein